MLTSLAAVVVLGVLLYADGREPGPSLPSAVPDDPTHVHSLALNPADESVLVGAHDGLYRFREGGKSLRRVGRGYQDTKALAVLGPDRILSSGHPDSQALQAGLPPHLGLVESRDGGRTWQSVSLAGKADFHVLRAVGQNVYGYDASARTLLASMDGGKTWAERVPPGDVFDLVVNPDDPSHLLLSTHSGLATSEDGGRTWATLGPERALLAWPAARTLYVVGANGETFVSADGGWSLTPRGSLDGAPAAVSAATDGSLYVALEDGTLRVSDDGGTTWRVASGIMR